MALVLRPGRKVSSPLGPRPEAECVTFIRHINLGNSVAMLIQISRVFQFHREGSFEMGGG